LNLVSAGEKNDAVLSCRSDWLCILYYTKLEFFNIGGSIDYSNTSELITRCIESISNFTENNGSSSKFEEFNWWMSKMDSFYVRNGKLCFNTLWAIEGTEFIKKKRLSAFFAAYNITAN